MSKLKDYGDINFFNPDNNEKQPKEKESVHSEVAKKFGDKFPLMKSLPKGEKTKTINFVVISRMERMAEEILYRCKPKYRTPSDVYRSALYNGMCQKYESEIIQGNSDRPSSFYANIKNMEPVYESQQRIDDTIFGYIRLRNWFEDGILTEEEARDKMEEILESLQKKERKIAEFKIKQVSEGAPVKDVFYHREGGGGRKKKDVNDGDYEKYTFQ